VGGVRLLLFFATEGLVLYLSGEYVVLLKKRALNALKWARRAFEEGDYDTAVREAEYAAQLYAKSLIYRVLGEERRGHDIRGLLGILAAALIEQGLNKEAERLFDFVRVHRRELAELTEAHTRAVYGLFEYGEREADLILRIAEEVIRLLESLEVEVFGEKARE